MPLTQAYQAAFGLMTEMIAIFDAKTGDVLDLTPGILDLLDYTHEEAMHLSFRSIFDDLTEAELQNGRIPPTHRSRTKCRKKNGHALWVDASFSFSKEDHQEWLIALLHNPDINEKNPHETETILNTAFDISPYAFAISTHDGEYLKVNQAFYDITGYKEDDIIGKRFVDTKLFVSEELSRKDHLLTELLESEIIRNKIIQVRHADQTVRHCLFSSSKILYQKKNCVLSVFYDITDLQHTEKLLSIERDLGIVLSQTSSLDQALNPCLESAMQVSGSSIGGIFLVDEKSGDLKLTVHRGFCDSFLKDGQYISAQSPHGQFIKQREPLYVEQGTLTPLDDLRECEGNQSFAILPVTTDDTPLALLYLTSWTEPKLSSASRSVLESIASHIGSSITRIKAESATQQKARELITLVNNIPGAVFIAEPHPPWHAQFMNNEIETISGYSAADFKEKRINYEKLIFPEDLPRIKEAIVEMFRNRTGYSLEYGIRHANGSTRCLFEKGSPSYDSQGRPTAIHGVNLDITERKRVEEAAKNAGRMKSEFLDTAAHELRTPLTVISIMIQHHQRLAARGEIIHTAILPRLLAQTARLENLTDELLHVSRLERGVFKVQKVKADLCSTVLDRVNAFRERHRQRAFNFTAAESPLFVEHDPDRMGLAISNLLDNAVKYSPRTSPIEIRVLPSTHTVRIVITDHGEGIPGKIRPFLFTRFFRGSTNETIQQPGLGLGLYLSKRIIEMHQGSIGFESEAGKGSTFFLALPKT